VKKTYIDTNVLVSYAIGPEKEPREYPKAKAIFEDIKQGKFVGVISTLTLIELKGVIRTLLGYDREGLETMPQNKQSDFIKSKADELYNALLAELLQLPYIKFEKGRQSNFQAVLDSSFDIMNEIKGDIRFYDKCGTCGAPYKSSKHKQILVADILHALLAKDTGCDSLITFDKGFKKLIGNIKVEQLEILVL